jgi:hypothetical protein
MFIDHSERILHNPPQRHYGIAVADLDHDGQFEFFVCGFGTATQNGARNLVLKWDGRALVDIADEALADEERMAIGVTAADIDGDGDEELYVLNTDTFGGKKRYTDRLFAFNGDDWTDLFSLPMNQETLNMTAGRSVAAVDRMGNGFYGIFVANYGGPMRYYELDLDGRLHDIAPKIGLNRITGGRSLLSLPLVSDRMDIFAGNENGANFLFRNNGDGTFTNVAAEAGIEDRFEHVRGIAPIDISGTGHLDIVYGNWEGAHRLYYNCGDGKFINIANEEMSIPTRVRTVIAADFDNDGVQEIFFNNINQPNCLFKLVNGEPREIPMGDAIEFTGLGTGAAVADIDGDGILELLVSHGESGVQPLTLYKPEPNNNNWLRVLPRTRYGAPARGAIVRLSYSGGEQTRVIDAGSGYLCQMEPVAHFGLGDATLIYQVEIQWTDGQREIIDNPAVNQMIEVNHPVKVPF